jgi:hypothetical protein
MTKDDKVFLIAVDWTHPGVDEAGLKEYIQGSQDFRNWWNHIPFVFLVSSPLDADSIADRIKPFTKDAKLLVIETNPDESEGWLPEHGWQWIRKRSGQATELQSQ